MKIMANGISMNYELVGSGKCLTLIHGVGDNLNAWFNQVPAFSQRYRVLTYDVRGHGQTELPVGEITSELLVDDLYAILKALKISETFLLGHSLGGAIALQFTPTYPEMVKALILSNGGGAARLSEEDLRQKEVLGARRQAQLETIKKEGMEAVVKDKFSLIFSPGFAEKNPDTVERYKSVFLQNKQEKYLRMMQRIGRFSVSSDPSKITCPTLVIYGEYDFGGQQYAKATQEAIPGSQLKVFPTGHVPAIEIPREYNETVLTFLAGVAD